VIASFACFRFAADRDLITGSVHATGEGQVNMEDKYNISGLQSLHRELLALSESRLTNLERLWVELEDRLEELKKLLDKPSKNVQHRQMVSSGRRGYSFSYGGLYSGGWCLRYW
jgi:hypothetical protein